MSQQQAELDRLALEIGRHTIEMKTNSLNNQQNIEQTLVNFEVAQVECDRGESSIKDKLISQRELEQRIATYKRAKLAYKHALQNYELQKESMQFEHKSKNAQRKQHALLVQELVRQVDDLQIKAPIKNHGVRHLDTGLPWVIKYNFIVIPTHLINLVQKKI